MKLKFDVLSTVFDDSSFLGFYTSIPFTIECHHPSTLPLVGFFYFGSSQLYKNFVRPYTNIFSGCWCTRRMWQEKKWPPWDASFCRTAAAAETQTKRLFGLSVCPELWRRLFAKTSLVLFGLKFSDPCIASVVWVQCNFWRWYWLWTPLNSFTTVQTL